MRLATTRSLLFTLAFFFIAHTAFAQSGPLANAPDDAVADTARQQAWQQFQQQHGAQWQIRWSNQKHAGRHPAQAAARKAPTTIFGALTKPYAGSPEQAARAFLSEHRSLFQMPEELTDLKKTDAVEFRGITHVRFQQTYEGIPVYEGDYLVHVREDGRIDMANGNYFAAIDAPTTPSISEQAARRTATGDLGGSRLELAEDAQVTSELMIYPKEGGAAFLLAWKVIVPAAKPEPGNWRYFIDATTGAIIDRHNRRTTIGRRMTTAERARAMTDKTLSPVPGMSKEHIAHKSSAAVNGNGTIIPDFPGDPGQYPSATPPEDTTLTNLDGNGRLEGFFASVDNQVASEAQESDHNFFYSTSDTHFDEANVYYHITAFFNQYAVPVLGFTDKIGVDRDLEADVHDTAAPSDAYYDPSYTNNRPGGKDVNFGDNFPFAKHDKIVYHESVHAILDAVNGGAYFNPTLTEEGAIGEGVSDYFAGGFTDSIDGPTDARILRGSLSLFFPLRDMVNPRSGIDTYSDYQNEEPVEEHDGGEFFSAVLWDLRQDFSLNTDAIDIIVLAAAARVDDSPDFIEYRDAMLAEDQSNYGGQYACTIKDALQHARPRRPRLPRCHRRPRRGQSRRAENLDHRCLLWQPFVQLQVVQRLLALFAQPHQRDQQQLLPA